MTNKEAINLILSQINNKALSYKFNLVTIEPIKDANTNKVSGYYITANFNAIHKDYISNYSAKLIKDNDGSVYKL